MTLVPIFDCNGKQINQLSINDDIEFVNGRVARGKKSYYKGVGVSYTSHFLEKSKEGYNVLANTNIFYAPYKVSKICFQNKVGIFQEKYQPFFSDFIGACGVKEGLIVLNSETFKYSSVEILDYHLFDKESNQSYYSLNYKCDRKSYLDNDGDPKKLKELLDYMILNDWNFLWDKGSINDVSYNALITDVADLFRSNELSHKLGTIYSIFYSLFLLNKNKYYEFLNYLSLKHHNLTSIIFNSIELLKENNIDISPLIISNNTNKNYTHIVRNFLIEGRNCAYCACNLYKDEGDRVRNEYIKRLG